MGRPAGFSGHRQPFPFIDGDADGVAEHAHVAVHRRGCVAFDINAGLEEFVALVQYEGFGELAEQIHADFLVPPAEICADIQRAFLIAVLMVFEVAGDEVVSGEFFRGGVFEIAAFADGGFGLRRPVFSIRLALERGRLSGKTSNPNLHAVGSFAVRRCPRFDDCHTRFLSWRHDTKHGGIVQRSKVFEQ